MTDLDPDLAAAVDRATARIARRLAAVTPLRDPEAAARQLITEDLLDTPDRWRPIPQGPGWLRKARRDPDVYERGAQLAREALNREDTDRE